jgi:hypothetical protein
MSRGRDQVRHNVAKAAPEFNSFSGAASSSGASGARSRLVWLLDMFPLADEVCDGYRRVPAEEEEGAELIAHIDHATHFPIFTARPEPVITFSDFH